VKFYTCGSTDKGVTHFNYLDFEISSVIAIIIIILSAIDYTQKKKRNNKGGIAISVILLIIGLIMLFLYNSYGSPLNQYHYIFIQYNII
jgi:ABC-type sulfate transport system permease component